MEERSRAAALGLLRRKSARGDGRAALLLADRLASGDGVAADAREAIHLYRVAAKCGLADAQYKLGALHHRGLFGLAQDAAEAVRWYRLAAEQGHADAQSILGSCYQLGQGVPQDSAEAVRWYRLAAEQGNTDSQFTLGLAYRDGKGVPQDMAEAVRWYRLAAEQGCADAQHYLGRCYLSGDGVPQDSAEAVRWHRLAVYGDICGIMPDYLTNAHRSVCLGSLGMLLLAGEGAQRDVEEGARLLRQAHECDTSAVSDLSTKLLKFAADRNVVSKCCMVCAKTGRGLKKCDRCRVAVFCSHDHLRQAWKAHKPHCRAWCEEAHQAAGTC